MNQLKRAKKQKQTLSGIHGRWLSNNTHLLQPYYYAIHHHTQKTSVQPQGGGGGGCAGILLGPGKQYLPKLLQALPVQVEEEMVVEVFVGHSELVDVDSRGDLYPLRCC